MIIIFILLIPIVIWFALKVAMCYSTKLKLFDMLPLLTASLNQPLYLHLNEYSIKTVLVFLVIYACGVGIYFTSAKIADREKNTAQQNGVMFKALHENTLTEKTS